MREELEELRTALDKAADSTARQVAITKLNQRMIKDLEGEIASFKSESAKQRKMLYTLEKASEGLPLTFPWRLLLCMCMQFRGWMNRFRRREIAITCSELNLRLGMTLKQQSEDGNGPVTSHSNGKRCTNLYKVEQW